MALRLPRGGRWYATCVTVCGLGLLAWLLLAGGVDSLQEASPLHWLFAFIVLVGELRPVRLPRGAEQGEITISTPFMFALLLAAPTPFAIAAVAGASAIADSVRSKPLPRLAFNVAMYTLSLAAAGAVLHLLGDGSGATLAADRLALADVPAVVLSALVFFAVNNTLTGVVIALEDGLPVVPFLRRDLGFQATTAGVLLGLSPVVAVIGAHNVVLMPLLLLPVMAVYHATRVSLEKEYEALHDGLTGLPNRTCFRQRGRTAVLDAVAAGQSLSVALVDLDRFKEINDTLGHHTGDLLLRALGKRLTSVLPPEAIVARLGGDEFAVCVRGVDAMDAGQQLAPSILGVLSRPFIVEGSVLDVEASIGIAVHPEHGDDVDTLLQRADVAMHLAKEDRVGHEVYNPQRDPNSRRRLALVGELRRALDTDQLVLHYQPKADLRTGRVAGVEALVRWQHPAHGMISPDEFIPLAEHTGLIGPLTLYVVDAALRQVWEWQRHGVTLPVAVNLSVRNLYDPQFPREVARLLRKWQVPADLLELEITESTVMARPGRARPILDELSQMGIVLAIDDFGTGYSSMAYLKQLPVQQLKIDKSFVLDMAVDNEDAAIVRAMIGLARSLGLKVVAEGVETADVWQLLVDLRCDLAQGYYLSRPVGADELVRWLNRGFSGLRLRHDREAGTGTTSAPEPPSVSR